MHMKTENGMNTGTADGTVMLDEKDQDLALRLLNYRGEYNEFGSASCGMPGIR